MHLTGRHSIAGQWRAEGLGRFHAPVPRSHGQGEIAFYNATAHEIDLAVTAASAAYAETRTYSPERLAAFLDRVAGEIEALGEVLIEVADTETALGSVRLTGERARTTGQLRAFAALLREGSYVDAIIDTALPDRQPLPRPDIRRMLFPIGPVAVFSASNFPFAFAVCGGDSASAWAAGCPVVVKGHPGHPATSELFAQAVNRAIEASGFPPGFFSLLQGETVEVGQTLVEHPLIAGVGFTGSLRAGRAIFDTASRRPQPIPVYAEMGSINPVILLPGALAVRAGSVAEALVASATLGSGQFCTNPGLLLVIDSPASADFIADYTARMSAKSPGVLLNAAIERGLAQVVAQTAAKEAVEVRTGGMLVEGSGCCYAHTVMQTNGAAFLADDGLQVEHFGPVTLFVVCRSLDELKACITALHGQLTATIYAEDDEAETARELYDLLREKAGRLIWNGVPTGVEVVAAQQHGGPYPATTAPATTSVGMTAIRRWLRPVAFQNLPDALLPPALQNANPLGIWRWVDGALTRDAIV